MTEYHHLDPCPQCRPGVLLADEVIPHGGAMILRCDRCGHRRAVPPPLSARRPSWEQQ